MSIGNSQPLQVVTVEEYVGGSFEKYINNNGEILGDPDRDVVLKALAYQHFSFQVKIFLWEFLK